MLTLQYGLASSPFDWHMRVVVGGREFAAEVIVNNIFQCMVLLLAVFRDGAFPSSLLAFRLIND